MSEIIFKNPMHFDELQQIAALVFGVKFTHHYGENHGGNYLRHRFLHTTIKIYPYEEIKHETIFFGKTYMIEIEFDTRFSLDKEQYRSMLNNLIVDRLKTLAVPDDTIDFEAELQLNVGRQH